MPETMLSPGNFLAGETDDAQVVDLVHDRNSEHCQEISAAPDRHGRLTTANPFRSLPSLAEHAALQTEQRLKLEQVAHQFGSLTLPVARFFEESIFPLPAASWRFGEGQNHDLAKTTVGLRRPQYKTFLTALGKYRIALDTLYEGCGQQLSKGQLVQLEQAVRVSWRQLNAQFRLQLQRLIGDMRPNQKQPSLGYPPGRGEGVIEGRASLLDMTNSRDLRYLLGLGKTLTHQADGLFIVDAAAYEPKRSSELSPAHDWLHRVAGRKSPPVAPRAASARLASHGVIVSTTTFGLCASASGWLIAIGMGFGSACLATRHTTGHAEAFMSTRE